jgi:hypothetical protein
MLNLAQAYLRRARASAQGQQSYDDSLSAKQLFESVLKERKAAGDNQFLVRIKICQICQELMLSLQIRDSGQEQDLPAS